MTTRPNNSKAGEENPPAVGQVIVTLMFTGPGHKLPNGPTVYSLVSDTVLELWAGA